MTLTRPPGTQPVFASPAYVRQDENHVFGRGDRVAGSAARARSFLAGVPDFFLAGERVGCGRSAWPMSSYRKRLGTDGRGFPHFMRVNASEIVRRSWARVMPT